MQDEYRKQIEKIEISVLKDRENNKINNILVQGLSDRSQPRPDYKYEQIKMKYLKAKIDYELRKRREANKEVVIERSNSKS